MQNICHLLSVFVHQICSEDESDFQSKPILRSLALLIILYIIGIHGIPSGV